MRIKTIITRWFTLMGRALGMLITAIGGVYLIIQAAWHLILHGMKALIWAFPLMDPMIATGISLLFWVLTIGTFIQVIIEEIKHGRR